LGFELYEHDKMEIGRIFYLIGRNSVPSTYLLSQLLFLDKKGLYCLFRNLISGLSWKADVDDFT